MAASRGVEDRVFDVGAHVGDRVASLRGWARGSSRSSSSPPWSRWIKMVLRRSVDARDRAVAVCDSVGKTTMLIQRR